MAGGFIINDAGGGGTVDAAAIVAAVADPADAADVAAAVDRRFVDAMTGDGWTATTPSGGALATWGSGKLTVLVPPSTSGGAGIERDDGVIPADAPEWDVLVRFDIVTGDTAASTRIAIAAGIDSSNYATAMVWANGTIELGKVVGGSWGGLGFGGVAALDATARTGGQAWLRLSRRLGYVFASCGIGVAGAVPTAWRTTQRSDDVDAARVAGGTFLRISAGTTDTSVTAGFTVDFLAIRARGAAPL